MNKYSKYRDLLDNIKMKICRAEMGVTNVYQVMLETLDKAEKEELAINASIKSLAMFVYNKYYKVESPDFELLDSTDVVISQLDNMIAGLPDTGPKWISVDTAMPDRKFEHSAWDHDGEVCLFDGMVSQSVEVTDGYNWARAHYQSNGVWHMYDESQHDFLNVDPDEVTHWMPMIKLPEPPTNELKAPDKEVTA